MKKNRMMRLASVLLVAVLMTTCTISGTFAKYVTEDSADDIARVAKWGVKITPNGAVFEQKYKTDDTTTYTGENSVVSSDTWDVVAPGTGDRMTKVVLSGKPEVAYKVDYAATVTLNNWKVGGEEYFPIYFTVNGVTYGHKTCGQVLTNRYNTIAELIAAVEKAMEDSSKPYGPNEDLSSVTVPEVSWSWPFYTSAANDKLDTALGDQAADSNHAVIKIEMTTTVTQID